MRTKNIWYIYELVYYLLVHTHNEIWYPVSILELENMYIFMLLLLFIENIFTELKWIFVFIVYEWHEVAYFAWGTYDLRVMSYVAVLYPIDSFIKLRTNSWCFGFFLFLLVSWKMFILLFLISIKTAQNVKQFEEVRINRKF